MSNSISKPFCACSTPQGVGGIAIIRASGSQSAELMDSYTKILRTAECAYGNEDKKITLSGLPGYVSAYATIIDPVTKKAIDNVIITHFVAPHSYTGDEMVEISCHGGEAVKQEILRIMLENGFRAAEPGEFTRTAFLNGKLDLSEAEAVMDVIAADSERALRAANMQMNGKLSKELGEVEDIIYHALTLIEMIVEFPEHDDTPDNEQEVISMATDALDRLNKLKMSYAQGRILSERMRVAICGSPNSGKSSLLNVLSGYERAIVTEVAGTTRDTLEVNLNINGIPVTLIDTAGIRDTDDRIEAIGVERAYKELTSSDLVLYMVSPTEELSNFEFYLTEILKSTTANRLVLVFSKSDAGENKYSDAMINKAKEAGVDTIISISSMNQINIEELKEVITSYYDKLGGSASGSIILLNRRHFELIDSATESLNMAIGAIRDGMGVDIASSVMRNTLEAIGKITGKTVSVELANNIFGRFCIGK
ncbi:MAG: tRNA uridine-5-carboxymethylaminomethyl(34) synthesis GTPase MnmE [Clostridia bacterium]|nr:tRNA uridine-5-carboxymethylaminomethyl(34) synthesis GTPase MnmE [Clostridia bacterium]